MCSPPPAVSPTRALVAALDTCSMHINIVGDGWKTAERRLGFGMQDA
jgi:hypothetical protein